MTNLTDEGLQTLAYETIRNCKGSQYMFPKLLASLQQIRDASREEMKEKCAVVAENMDVSERDNPRSAKSHADNIATAIRQMDGGR